MLNEHGQQPVATVSREDFLLISNLQLQVPCTLAQAFYGADNEQGTGSKPRELAPQNGVHSFRQL